MLKTQIKMQKFTPRELIYGPSLGPQLDMGQNIVRLIPLTHARLDPIMPWIDVQTKPILVP